MTIDTTAIITAAAAPALGLIGVLLRSFLADRSYRKIERFTELHEKLPTSAQSLSESLLNELVAAYAIKAQRKLYRQVDRANIAALVVIGFPGFVVTYYLITTGNSAEGPSQLALYLLAVLVGLIFFLFMLVGVSQIFAYPGDKNYKPEKEMEDWRRVPPVES